MNEFLNEETTPQEETNETAEMIKDLQKQNEELLAIIKLKEQAKSPDKINALQSKLAFMERVNQTYINDEVMKISKNIQGRDREELIEKIKINAPRYSAKELQEVKSKIG